MVSGFRGHGAWVRFAVGIRTPHSVAKKRLKEGYLAFIG